jgi:hypothetical protein
MRDLYKELLRLRRDIPGLARLSRRGLAEVDDVLGDDQPALFRVDRSSEVDRVTVTFNLSANEVEVPAGNDVVRERVLLDSADERWGGPGSMNPTMNERSVMTKVRHSPWSFIVVHRCRDEEVKE